MGYWAYMLVNTLLIPVVMLIFGHRFLKKGAPKDINGFYGYRTRRSMMSWDAWEFAHRYFGKLWQTAALVMIPVSAALMALTFKLSIDAVSIFGVLLMGVQAAVIVISIFVTESALKKNFDERGHRTEESLAKEQAKLEAAQSKAENKQKKEKVKK